LLYIFCYTIFAIQLNACYDFHIIFAIQKKNVLNQKMFFKKKYSKTVLKNVLKTILKKSKHVLQKKCSQSKNVLKKNVLQKKYSPKKNVLKKKYSPEKNVLKTFSKMLVKNPRLTFKLFYFNIPAQVTLQLWLG
jgi:hypothetical protein